MIDLRPSPDQQQVIDSIAGYLRHSFPLEGFQANAGTGTSVRDAWRDLAAQGFFGLAMAEEAGGAGFTVVEEMLAQREFARGLLSPSVLAAGIAAHVAHAAGLTDLAAAIVAGERHVAFGSEIAPLSAGPLLDGSLHLIDSQEGDLIVVATARGPILVERDQLIDPTAVTAMDETLCLHRAEARSLKALAQAPELKDRCALLIAAALLGMAEAARDMAVEHAGLREQFGKPIGAFQGVAHHCADMELRARAARAQTAFAAIALADDRSDAAFHISAAALVAGDAAVRNATMAIRVLGAMGFTAECALHLYLKRSHLHERLAGGNRLHSAELLRYDGADIRAAD
jgi:alkylation response protein AidB-like acyl-CoA dehydrogenase